MQHLRHRVMCYACLTAECPDPDCHLDVPSLLYELFLNHAGQYQAFKASNIPIIVSVKTDLALASICSGVFSGKHAPKFLKVVFLLEPNSVQAIFENSFAKRHWIAQGKYARNIRIKAVNQIPQYFNDRKEN